MNPGDRVSASVLRRHVQVLSSLVGSSGSVYAIAQWFGNPQNQKDIGDLAGNLNKAEADQYPTQPPSGPPGLPPPSSTPWPAGTFGPPVVDAPITMTDSQDREVNVDTDRIYCLPMLIPPKPWNQTKVLNMAACEYRSPPALGIGWFSRTPGVWDTSIAPVAEGTTQFVMCPDAEKAGLNPGETIYFNLAFWSSDIGGRTWTGVKNIRIGGHWPR